MTDNEIIKALECCIHDRIGCEKCPLFGDGSPNCWEAIRKNTLDLINRLKRESNKYRNKVQAQKGELTRVYKENDVLKTNCDSMCLSMPNMAKAERAEAIKEFAERLKDEPSINIAGQEHLVILKTYIDNLVKEMVGDSK